MKYRPVNHLFFHVYSLLAANEISHSSFAVSHLTSRVFLCLSVSISVCVSLHVCVCPLSLFHDLFLFHRSLHPDVVRPPNLTMQLVVDGLLSF